MKKTLAYFLLSIASLGMGATIADLLIPIKASIRADNRIGEIMSPAVRISYEDGSSFWSGTFIGPTTILSAAHPHFLRPEVATSVLMIVEVFRWNSLGQVVETEKIRGEWGKVGDACCDLSIIQLVSAPKIPVAIAPIYRGQLSLFQPVYVVGCPKRLEPRVTPGIVSFLGEEYGTALVSATANTYFGNSGGALMVEEKGHWYLAGVLSRVELGRMGETLPWLSYFVPVEQIREFVR